MLNTSLYIHAACAILPEASREPALRREAREPDYSGFIPPMQLRRMSKLVRMSIGAAQGCLQQTGQSSVDAILMGTAFGCLADTEQFLKKMLEQEEQMLSPTAFIQSTHNTPAGQIALGIGCRGYNNTLSQQGHSFENAVLAARLYLEEQPGAELLCGGGDELTPTSQGLLQRIGIYCTQPQVPGTTPRTEGAVAGEGVGFFLLRKKREGALACIRSIECFHENQPGRAAMRFQKILEAGGGLRNTDQLLVGALPDARSEIAYADVLSFGIPYRNPIGAWPTDAAAALADLMAHWPADRERAWLCTHWGSDWSVWLLERV